MLISLALTKRETCTYFIQLISVTDGIKMNEQNKSIGKGPLYLQTEFEAIWLLLPKGMAGVSNAAKLARSKCNTPKNSMKC